MKFRLLILLWMPLLVACGQEKSHAVYDTDSNPDNFPPRAVDVISRIESGALVGADAITQAFGDLLTEHGDLLDRPEWRKAVDNMGGLFRRTADSLASRGVGSYSLAAEYYQLGLLARPEDTAMRRLSGMFESWQRGVQSTKINAAAEKGDFGSLDAVLDVTSFFIPGDTLSRQFFGLYFAPEIRKWSGPSGALAPEAVRGLNSLDRALLASVGLVDTTGLGRLTTFGESGIDLVAARITQLDTSYYQAEFYLLPHLPVKDLLKVYVRLSTAEGGAYPVEFVPQPPTTSWRPGQVVLVTGTFNYAADLYAAAVGLADFVVPRPNFARPTDSRSDLFLVPQTDIVRK
jgi:hypothetical protein